MRDFEFLSQKYRSDVYISLIIRTSSASLYYQSVDFRARSIDQLKNRVRNFIAYGIAHQQDKALC